MSNLKGNLSTVIKFIIMTFAPSVAANEVATDGLVTVAVGVIGFILAFIDARYPNTLIDEDVA